MTITNLHALGGSTTASNDVVWPGVNTPFYSATYNKGRYVRISGEVSEVYPLSGVSMSTLAPAWTMGPVTSKVCASTGVGQIPRTQIRPLPAPMPQVDSDVTVTGISSSLVNGSQGVYRVICPRNPLVCMWHIRRIRRSRHSLSQTPQRTAIHRAVHKHRNTVRRGLRQYRRLGLAMVQLTKH